jgi:LacI family transcriptional regulator
MKRKRKITLKDVAQRAGVSTQTVSRVVNNSPDVLPQTRDRVQKAINELGYAPNVIARSLSRGRSNTLGIVGFGLKYYGSTSVLIGIERTSNELGYSLIFSLLEKFEPSRIDDILNSLLSRQVEGIIWAVPGQNQLFEWVSEKVQNLSIPIIFLNEKENDEHIILSMDNQMGARLATEHLLELGYQRVGIITGPQSWWEAREREAGWRIAMHDAGFDDEELEFLRVEGDWSAASGDIGLYKLHEQSPDLDAVFASNDQMALGAMQAARRFGLAIPQDLGIVGFDDTPEAAYFYPPLTTIRQNLENLGALAVNTIHGLIQARHDNRPFKPSEKQIKPRLIVRKSSKKNSE